MGIELPRPTGEQGIPPHYGGEQPAVSHNGEIIRPVESVENNSTERPAAQEVRTGQGAGDGFSAQPLNDVNATSQLATPAAATTTTTSLDDVPVVAADEDLIEKQWVDSAKRIIKETRNDPYQQGKAISRLQADYLQKRYGKTLAAEGDLS